MPSIHFLLKVNIHLHYDPEILLLRSYPREIKTCIYTKSYTQRLARVLYIIASTGNNTKGRERANE